MVAFLRRNRTTVGLDIGSGLIKLVAISHASGGPVLTKVAFTSVVNDAIVVGEVMDPAIVADRGERHLGQHRTAGCVRDRDELDQAASDVQPDRRRRAPEESHSVRWLRRRSDISKFSGQPMCHTNCTLAILCREAA
jgi:hypothetical protein